MKIKYIKTIQELINAIKKNTNDNHFLDMRKIEKEMEHVNRLLETARRKISKEKWEERKQKSVSVWRDF